MRSLAILLALSAVSCGFDPPNGHLLCASSGKACPDGMECVEAHCWRKGTAPADLSMEPKDDLAVPLKDKGQPCTMDSECSSAACADNVCCDKACKGQCEACDSTGMCKPVTGTPLAPRACGGMSTCLGTCDGTKPDCSFPLSGTICGGACDGTCNGTGVCSSTGGVCPGGYACGVGSCKTSCTGPADCQSNFVCNGSSMCQRIPESDCLDGVDNNGDGLIDCADPMCTAGFACVPIPQAGTPLGVHITGGACPTNYTVAMPAYHSGLTNGSCSGCTCQTFWNATVSAYAANNTCTGSATTSKLHAGAESVFCDAVSGNFQSVGLTVFGADHCTTGGTVTYSGATWATNDTFCVARTSNTCGDANQVCAAKPMGAAGMCDAIPSGVCPTGYANNNGVTYYTNYSGGGCNACNCSNGSNKPVIIGSAYQAAACGNTGLVQSAIGNGACKSFPAASYLALKETFSYGAITDNCGVSATAKPVSGTTGTTFCCQN